MRHFCGLPIKTALLVLGAALGFLVFLIIVPYWTLALLGVAAIAVFLCVCSH